MPSSKTFADKLINRQTVLSKIGKRLATSYLFKGLFGLSTLFGLIVLIVLFYRIITQGAAFLDVSFITSMASRFAEQSGFLAAILGSLWLMAVTAPVSFILGVGTALYLEEYATDNRFSRFVKVNISNLAGVPSIVYGLLGLTIFVHMAHLGRSVLAGGLTLALLILPVIVVASQEAIRSVPNDLREASYGMGATKWQTIRRVVLPAAIPGILTGTILALSRAVGETAPLVAVGVYSFVTFLPDGLLSKFTAMPVQIFSWVGLPQSEFQALAASGIIVLLVFMLIMNAIAVFIRNKFTKRY